MIANNRQVGGAHYISEIQHWDWVAANNLDYFQGQITKYVARWRDKNGLQDLEKALHFLQKYIELNTPPGYKQTPDFHPTDPGLNPNLKYPARQYCTCEMNGQIVCPIHGSDGDEPTNVYVNQDR